jgi:hypothetical protein
MYNYKLNNILDNLDYNSRILIMNAINSIDCELDNVTIKVYMNHPSNFINNLLDCLKAINKNIRIQSIKHETCYDVICNWDLGELIVPEYRLHV